MSLFNLFGGTPASGAPATPANSAPNVSPAPNTSVQPNATETNSPAPGPLANYADLWQAPENPASNSISDIFNIDTGKLHEAAKNIDFTKALTPDLVQKIQGGGQDAMTAVIEAMSSMSQYTFANNAAMTAKLVQAALEKVQTKYDKRVEDLIRSRQLDDQLVDSNPAFNNPAAKPIIDSLTSQFRVKHPNATSREIAVMVNDYLNDFSKMFTPGDQKSAAKNSSSNKEVDWSALFNI